tara:strand:+ start:166 stop:372 length:207 start_codon:yes stop_codon:yes gene_type:complete
MKIYIARVSDDFDSRVTAFASKREMEKHVALVRRDEDANLEIDTFVTHVQPRKKDVIAWFNTHAWHDQ